MDIVLVICEYLTFRQLIDTILPFMDWTHTGIISDLEIYISDTIYNVLFSIFLC